MQFCELYFPLEEIGDGDGEVAQCLRALAAEDLFGLYLPVTVDSSHACNSSQRF